jgi:nucleoside-diphosphate-sugar epimerase
LSRLNAITGATGLLGSHIAEQLVQRGERVRALVRASSDPAFLRSLGVELLPGDLQDRESLRRLADGADVVYHCAARVGDWAAWPIFQQGVIEATANVIEACQAAPPGRLLHVSSIMVYGHPKLHEGLITEDAPLGRERWRGDYYCKAKTLAEHIVHACRVPWTVVRPSWIYGPRDRNSLPRVLKALAAGRAWLVGKGDNRLNIVYAADVADGCIRAAHHPGAVGRAYNLSSEGAISQRDFLNALTDALGRRRVRRWLPYRVAFAGATFAELIGWAIRMRRPPHITRYAVALIGRPTHYSIERARKELGWEPRTPPLEGLRRTLEWYFGPNGPGADHRPAGLTLEALGAAP